MHIGKAELVFGQKDLLQHTIWTPAVLSVLANLMMAVPQLKIVGFTGLPWFCYMAAASFMLAAIVRLLVCWAATCSLSESQQHSLTDLHDDGALQTCSRVVDQIFRYCIFFQMSVWAASCLPDNAILLSIILTVLPYVLGALFCFAAWYAKSKRLQQIKSWAWSFTWTLICGFIFATSQHESNTRRHFAQCLEPVCFVLLTENCFSGTGVLFASPEDEDFQSNPLLWVTAGRPVFRKFLAWGFLILNFATTLIYFMVFYDEKPTLKASFTDWFG